jgi:hypothetical protein
MDRAFVDCIAARRAYRPASAVRDRALRAAGVKFGKRPWRMWDYPELLLQEGSVSGDGFTPVRRFQGKAGAVAAVFCRAWLWKGEGVDVLFLDGPVAGAGVRRIRRESGGSGRQAVDAKDSETESLEDVLWDAIRGREPEGGGWGYEDGLDHLLVEIVYCRWLELFDVLEPQSRALSDETIAGYWQILQSLELNEEEDGHQRWAGLMSRAQRRIALLPPPRDRVSRAPPATSRETTGITVPSTPRNKTISRTGTFNRSFKSGYPRQANDDQKRLADENQRALDRISYMGGILIPLPIVAGILSMGETFGPGGPSFYIFWAAAIPLSFLTVLIIYADTIRRAEVWVEIAPERVEPTPDSSTKSSKEDIGPVNVEVKRQTTVTWKRPEEPQQGQHGSETSSQDAVVFALDHDVEERMTGMPLAAAAATVQPSDEEVAAAVLDLIPGPERWGTGLVQPPGIILEQPADGSRPRAWKRQELGWYGAVKSIVYKKPRPGDNIPVGVPATPKPDRRKTRSF